MSVDASTGDGAETGAAARYVADRLGLAGRRAVIVGGGGGLGRACADDLAGAGVDLALADRNADTLDETVAAVSKRGVDVVHQVLDAREPEALDAFYHAVADAFDGRIDILVNVVGGTFHQPFADSRPRGWDAIIRSNFTWLLHSTHAAIPLLRRAGGGSIVNITSIEAHRAAPGFAVYAGTKAAVTNFGRTLALELAPDAIRVNTIAPDLVPTAGMQALSENEGAAGQLGVRLATPLGRLGAYTDVGGVALFLASDLSAFVTGSTVHPDGGALASSGWQNWGDDGYRLRPPDRLLRAYVEDPQGPT